MFFYISIKNIGGFMKESAEKSLAMAQSLFTHLKEKLFPSGSDSRPDIIIFGVGDDNSSIVTQLLLSKLAYDAGYEIILPYDLSKLIRLEKEVLEGKLFTFEHNLFKALMSSDVSYYAAYLSSKNKDIEANMLMKDREFAIEVAKRKKALNSEDLHIANLCKSRATSGNKIICVVANENMQGVKENLDGFCISEFSQHPKEKIQDKTAKTKVVENPDSGSELEREVITDPYMGERDYGQYAGITPSIDGSDNVSRHLEKALTSSSLEEKVARLEDLCLAIYNNHSAPDSRRIPEYWLDAAIVIKKKKYYLGLESNVDLSCLGELASVIYMDFESIFHTLSIGDEDTLSLTTGAELPETPRLTKVVIHLDYLKDKTVDEILRMVRAFGDKGLEELIIDSSTVESVEALHLDGLNNLMEQITSDPKLSFLRIFAIGRVLHNCCAPLIPTVSLNVEGVASWLTAAGLRDSHPRLLAMPIDLLFTLRDAASDSLDVLVARECVKARLKELKDDIYSKRLTFRKGAPVIVKETILELSTSVDSQNYAFEILGMTLRVLSHARADAEVLKAREHIQDQPLYSESRSHKFSSYSNSSGVDDLGLSLKLR